MKKFLFIIVCCVMVSTTFTNAQDKTGVKTTEPTEIFDVNGTMRIRDLPTNGTGFIYHGETNKNTNFIATKTIVVNDEGDMGVVNTIPSTEPLYIENSNLEATKNNQNVYQNGKLGIGDFSHSNITNPLHVKATQNPLRLEGLQLSDGDSNKVLVVNDEGVVQAKIEHNSKFVGFMLNNQDTYGQNIHKIEVGDVLFDKKGEFNVSNNTFTPKTTGFYRIEITITSNGYDYNQYNYRIEPKYNGSTEERAVLGLAERASGGDEWVARLAFNLSADQRATSVITSAKLEANKSYYFGIAGSSDYKGVYLRANPEGTTGIGKGSYFEISRLD